MKKSYWFVLAHVALILICGLILEFFVKADGSVIHKLLAGFFIGTYAMFGKEIAKLGLACAIKRRLPVFDSNPWTNGFTLGALVILALAGLFAWVVSWEGSTGVYFGLAVFLAALFSDEGLVPLFAEFVPSNDEPISA